MRDIAFHLTDAVKRRARDLGFDMVRITPVAAPPHARPFLDWLASGLHGEMAYLAERAALRLNPAVLAPGARSMIMLLRVMPVSAEMTPEGPTVMRSPFISTMPRGVCMRPLSVTMPVPGA